MTTTQPFMWRIKEVQVYSTIGLYLGASNRTFGLVVDNVLRTRSSITDIKADSNRVHNVELTFSFLGSIWTPTSFHQKITCMRWAWLCVHVCLTGQDVYKINCMAMYNHRYSILRLRSIEIYGIIINLLYMKTASIYRTAIIFPFYPWTTNNNVSHDVS